MKNLNSLPKCLNGFHLKLIAIVSMLIDHIAYIVLPALLGASYAVQEGTVSYHNFKQPLLLWMAEHDKILWNINDVMHWIGRLAFPLFCFLIVQGFQHTRSRGKYAFRLGLFALISEVPYDMAFNNCLLTVKNNNVFFTLLVGLLMIWGIDEIKAILAQSKLTGKMKRILHIASIILFSAVAAFLVTYVFDSSYGSSGVLTILVFYLLPNHRGLAACISTFFLCAFNFSVMQIFALPAALPIQMYNGKRGPEVKYFFYLCYPIHLLMFAVLAMWVGNLTLYMGVV